jgi:hypothetical protein
MLQNCKLTVNDRQDIYVVQVRTTLFHFTEA